MPVYSIKAQVGFADSAYAAAPTWYDISSDVKGFTTHRGRTYEMNRIEAGTAVLSLNNVSGNYWKNNTGGAYYPNVIPMKQVNIQATSNIEQLTNRGFEYGNPPTNWTIGYGAGMTYAQSTAQVHSGTYSMSLTRSGNDGGVYQTIFGYPLNLCYKPCTVNLTGWVWASAASTAAIEVNDGIGFANVYHPGDSQWHQISVSRIVDSAATYVNIFCDIKTNNTTVYFDDLSVSVSYNLFTGFSESWTPGFVQPPIKIPEVTLSCVDLTKSLSRVLINNAGYASELSGARVGHVLDFAGWPAGLRAIATGISTLQATGVNVNVNAKSHLDTVQTSEQGLFFMGTNGKAVYQDRHSRLSAPYITSQYIFTDAGGKSYVKILPANDDQYIYNDVRVTRVGGTEQTASDASSQTAYGLRSLSITGLLVTTDGECLSLAQYMLGRYKAPLQRIRQLVVRPESDPANLFPIVWGLDISSRITVVLTQASVNEDYFIEGITHTYKPGDPWVTTYDLSPAGGTGLFWLLGSAGFGELGATTFLGY